MDLIDALDRAGTKQADRDTELADLMDMIDGYAGLCLAAAMEDDHAASYRDDATDTLAAIEERLRQVLDSRS